MKSIRVSITLSAETINPMHEHICESAAIDREFVLEGKVSDGTETVLSYVQGDRDACEDALASMPHVEEYDVTPDGDHGCFVYARATLREQDRELSAALARETVVLVPPIEFRPDRTMRLTLIGHPGDLQGVLADLPDGMDPEVLRVGGYEEAVGQRLTDRQREALATAWASGYYEVPRGDGLAAVADELGCATSTASDLLRRAEARLVREALDVTAG